LGFPGRTYFSVNLHIDGHEIRGGGEGLALLGIDCQARATHCSRLYCSGCCAATTVAHRSTSRSRAEAAILAAGWLAGWLAGVRCAAGRACF
jgi:hypothetical protein